MRHHRPAVLSFAYFWWCYSFFSLSWLVLIHSHFSTHPQTHCPIIKLLENQYKIFFWKNIILCLCHLHFYKLCSFILDINKISFTYVWRPLLIFSLSNFHAFFVCFGTGDWTWGLPANTLPRAIYPPLHLSNFIRDFYCSKTGWFAGGGAQSVCLAYTRHTLLSFPSTLLTLALGSNIKGNLNGGLFSRIANCNIVPILECRAGPSCITWADTLNSVQYWSLSLYWCRRLYF